MHDVTYWFRPTDDCRYPSTEWMRQTGAAIAAAASVIPWDNYAPHRRPWIDIYVGTVHWRQPMDFHAEGVSFRTESFATIDRIDEALRDLGASRAITTTREDPATPSALAGFGFLYRGALLRLGWWGRENERSLRDSTGLRTLCARNEDEDTELASMFGRSDAAAALSSFYARAKRRSA